MAISSLTIFFSGIIIIYIENLLRGVMEEFEKMKSGLLYNPAESGIAAKHNNIMALCEKLNRVTIKNQPRRKKILKKIIPSMGDGAFIVSPFNCEYGSNIKIGKNFFSNFNCIILDVAPVTIGDNAMFGPHVTLATPMHPLVASERAVQDYGDGIYDLEYARPITIGNGVWLASNVTVVGGVTIGDECVVGAGSVVTRDLPSGYLCMGTPCKPIRKITDADRLYVKETYDACRPLK